VRRRIKITVETESVLVVRRRPVLCRAWCAGCSAPSVFAPLGEVCALTLHDIATLERLSVEGPLHAVEADDGATLVCLRSALARPAG
jgi:hypothetical protein